MLALPLRRTALALTVVGFGLSAFAFFPGQAAPDAAFFGYRPAGYGLAILFVAHLLAFWIGLLLIAKAVIQCGASLGALVPLAGVFPMLFDFFRVVDPEGALATAWLLGFGLAFERLTAKDQVIAGAIGALAALAYGALVRLAALPAAFPPLFLFADQVSARPRWLRWAAPGFALVLVIGGALAFDSAAFDGAHHRRLIAFDLGDMSSRIGENLLPGRWTIADEAQVFQCGMNQWRGDGRCAFVVEKLPEKGLWASWALGVASHPGAYARHRIDHANRLLRWLGEAPEVVTDQAANVSSLRANGNPVAGVLAPIASALGTTPLFRGYAWLLAAGAVVWLAALATDSVARRFVLAAGVSALIYVAVQIACGVDDDFRRLFWPVSASLAGAGGLLACRWPAHSSRFGALILIGCVCVAAFAASALI